MFATLVNGKTLGPGDLSLLIRDANGALIDPCVVTYSIFSVMDGQRTLASPPKSVPARSSQGAYYVPITVPTVWRGEFLVVWYLIQYAGGAENTVEMDFQVVNVDPATSTFEAPSTLIAKPPIANNKYAIPIMDVRELIYDTDPDRNYHFRPPTPGKIVAGYTTRVGFIWLDSTILRFINIAISKLNTWNKMNLYSWTLDTIPIDWGRCAAVGAAGMCLTAEGARWAADEFSYSLNGVSLDINKAALYQSLGASLKEEFNEWAPLITANRPVSVGLRQQRWLLG